MGRTRAYCSRGAAWRGVAGGGRCLYRIERMTTLERPQHWQQPPPRGRVRVAASDNSGRGSPSRGRESPMAGMGLTAPRPAPARGPGGLVVGRAVVAPRHPGPTRPTRARRGLAATLRTRVVKTEAIPLASTTQH